MKKILTILFISFSVAAQSQVLQTPQIFGTLYRNLGAKEGLVIPTFCGTPPLPPSVKNYRQSAIAYDSCNHIFYVFSPTDSTWKTISGSGLDSLSFHSASLNSDSTQLSLTRSNGTKDTIPLPFVKKTDTTVIKVHYPLWAFTSDSLGLRTDSMPKLEYAIAGRDTSTWDNQTLIDKQFLQDRISTVTATGITRTELQDTAAAIRSSMGSGSVLSVTGNPSTLVNNTDPANPVIQQDASKLDKSDSTIANRVTANTSNIATNTSNIASNTTAIAGKQNTLTLTTTGTSGAATLTGATLNIPQYTGGGGAGGTPIDTVATITALENTATTTRYVYVSDSLRGGFFNYVATGLTPDSGTVFNANGKGGGFWKRQMSGANFIPEWFGAKGNGTTDDAAAFNLAVGAMTTGGEMTLKATTYLINSTVTLNKSIKINGMGMGATTIQQGTNNTTAFRIVEDKCILSNMKILSTQASPTSGCAVRIDSNLRTNGTVIKFEFSHINFYGFYNSVEATNTFGWTIADCSFQNVANYGVVVSNNSCPDCGDSYITGCSFTPLSASTFSYIYQTNSGGLRIINNKFNKGNFKPKYDYYGVVSNTQDLLITGNSFENYTVSAIKLVGPSVYYNNVTITGNQFAGGTNGTRPDIQIDSAQQISITGNVFAKYYATGNDTAIALTNVRDVNVNNSYTGSGVFYGTPVGYNGVNTGTYGDGTGSKYNLPVWNGKTYQGVSHIQDSVGVINFTLLGVKHGYVPNYTTGGYSGIPDRLSIGANSENGDIAFINSGTSGYGFKFWQQTGPTSALKLLDLYASGRVAIGYQAAGDPGGAKLDIVSPTEQLRLKYDASNYARFTVGSTGTLTVTPTGGAVSIASDLSTTGNFTLATRATKMYITDGTNAIIGSTSLINGTITVANISVTASSKIFLTVASPSGTVGFLSVGTITAGTSFVINSTSATDNSLINWWIIN